MGSDMINGPLLNQLFWVRFALRQAQVSGVLVLRLRGVPQPVLPALSPSCRPEPIQHDWRGGPVRLVAPMRVMVRVTARRLMQE